MAAVLMGRTGQTGQTGQQPPAHLVGIDGGWSLWRTICLRSTGFPIAMLAPLGSPVAARAIDAAFDAGGADAEIEAAAGTCAAEIARISRSVRELAGAPRFREAVTWQNRSAVRDSFDYLLRHPEGGATKYVRRSELLVARYAQRYCSKNDTIGFFGPIGWGTVVSGGPAVQQKAGPDLLARRHTYFEHWCIDELARALAEDPELMPWLTPRRHPTVRVDGTSLWDGRLRRAELPLPFARLLVACDGTRAAGEIARDLAADPELELDGEDEVHDLLNELVAKNLAFWTLEVPTLAPHPERALYRRLGRAAQPARERALAVVGELEQERARVAAASGRVDALDGALADLEQRFEGMTGRAAVRKPGAFYAGRRLIYEDCTRDVELRLGPLFVERLAAPLELILHSARWYTWTVAQRYLAAVRQAHRELCAALDSPEVDYLRLWEQIAPIFPNGDRPSPIVADVIVELKRRWAELLGLPLATDERRATRSADQLRARVRDAFHAPGPGWPWARYHCPDILVAAGGPGAAERGDFSLVLGELHCAVHTYVKPIHVELNRDGAALLRALEADIEAPCVFPITPRKHATRADFASLSSRDFDLEIGDTPSHRSRDRVLAVADLVAEEIDDRLIVRTRDREHRFDALAFFGYYLSAECMSQFRLLPDAPHVPRVAIDHLVIARERWTFAPGDLPFCHGQAGRQERFRAARRWVLAHGLPRFTFLKVPEEPKPIYIDLESPLYVEVMARAVRKASSVSISEMLPGPDETWLVDAQGNRYTSELRIAAVDPIAWSPT
jgi:hypothetical protein